MRCRRVIGLLVAVAAALLIAPAAAFADPYPAQPPPASVSSGTVSAGGMVTFSGRGFLPFEKISIVVSFAESTSSAALPRDVAGGSAPIALRSARRSTLIVTADRTGAFSVQVPLSQVGSATLVATGLTSGFTVTAYVVVVAPPNGRPGGGGGGKPPPDGHPGGGGGGKPPSDGHPALPTTGQSGARLLTMVVGGATAVLLGGALVGFARRRRDDTE